MWCLCICTDFVTSLVHAAFKICWFVVIKINCMVRFLKLWTSHSTGNLQTTFSFYICWASKIATGYIFVKPLDLLKLHWLMITTWCLCTLRIVLGVDSNHFIFRLKVHPIETLTKWCIASCYMDCACNIVYIVVMNNLIQSSSKYNIADM